MTALDLLLFAQGQFGKPGGFNQPGGPGGFGGPGGVPPGAQAGAGAMIGIMICQLVFAFLFIALIFGSYWKMFTKAGEPGWAGIVPVYNCMILSKICGRGEMFGLLLLVPCVNIVISIMLMLDLAKVFGKDVGFAVGLILLPIVFLPILAFGSAQYVGAEGGGGGTSRRRRDYDEEEDDRPRPKRRRDEDDDDRIRRRPRDD